MVGLAHLKFDFVEALTIYAVHLRLSDKCVFVDRFDDAEYGDRFDFAAHYQQHLGVFLGIPSHAVEHRAAALSLIVDGCGYIFPVGGEDGELHRHAVGIYHRVSHEGDDKQRNHTVNQRRHCILKVEIRLKHEFQQHREGDHRQIEIYHRASDRHIALFRSYGGHDIRTSGRPVVDEYQADTQTAEHGSDDYVHKRLTLNGRRCEHRLEHCKRRRNAQYSE